MLYLLLLTLMVVSPTTQPNTLQKESIMRWSRLSWVVVFAIVLLVSSACQPIPAPVGESAATAVAAEEATTGAGESTSHASVSGFEIALPNGWAVADDAAGFMLVTSSPDLLAAEDLLPVPDGVLMMFLNMSKDEIPPLPLGDLLGMFIDSRALPADVTAGPEETTIGGQPAIRIAGAGEAEGEQFLYLAVGIETEARVGRLITVLPQAREDELRPLVESVIESVIVGEPTPVALDLSIIEGEIASGQPINATLEPDTTMIWHFTGTADQLLIVAATPSSALDIVVSLVDATGTPVLAIGEADSEGDGQAERRLATLPADGDYYVVIRGFTGSGGDFEVAITETSVASNVESNEDLIGTWGDRSTLYRVDEDGSFRVGFDAASLEGEPVYQGQVRVEDGLITLGRNEVGEFCADNDGIYEGVLLAGGELSLRPVEDTCPRRAFGLFDIVLPPAQE